MVSHKKSIILTVKTQMKNAQGLEYDQSQYKADYYQLKDWTYIRYEDKDGIATIVKIQPNGQVIILRRSVPGTQLAFSTKKDQSSHYRTPYGTVDLISQVNTFQYIVEKGLALSGRLTMTYKLLTEGNVLGDYRLDISFEEELAE